MPSDSFPDLSPEEEFAHKLAAQELAKYCQEFSRWRKTRRGRAILDECRPAPPTLAPPSIKDPGPPAPRSSA